MSQRPGAPPSGRTKNRLDLRDKLPTRDPNREPVRPIPSGSSKDRFQKRPADAEDQTPTRQRRRLARRAPGKSGGRRQSGGAGKSDQASRMKKPAYRMMMRRMRARLKARRKAGK
jgi:hypothetical protein